MACSKSGHILRCLSRRDEGRATQLGSEPGTPVRRPWCDGEQPRPRRNPDGAQPSQMAVEGETLAQRISAGRLRRPDELNCNGHCATAVIRRWLLHQWRQSIRGWRTCGGVIVGAPPGAIRTGGCECHLIVVVTFRRRSATTNVCLSPLGTPKRTRWLRPQSASPPPASTKSGQACRNIFGGSISDADPPSRRVKIERRNTG
jgi:hypothetical protein